MTLAVYLLVSRAMIEKIRIVIDFDRKAKRREP